MKYSFKKSITYPFLWWVLLTTTVVGVVWAVTGAISGGWRIDKNTTGKIYAYGECYNTTNTAGSAGDIFIPTNTATEWNYFKTYRPWTVTMTACTQTAYSSSNPNSGDGTYSAAPLTITCPGGTQVKTHAGYCFNTGNSPNYGGYANVYIWAVVVTDSCDATSCTFDCVALWAWPNWPAANTDGQWKDHYWWGWNLSVTCW